MLVKNPSLNLTDAPPTVRLNKAGSAYVLTIQMVVGSPEVNSFTPKGERAEKQFIRMGELVLDGSFTLPDGTEVRLGVQKAPLGRGPDRLICKPVTSKVAAPQGAPSLLA